MIFNQTMKSMLKPDLYFSGKQSGKCIWSSGKVRFFGRFLKEISIGMCQSSQNNVIIMIASVVAYAK